MSKTSVSISCKCLALGESVEGFAVKAYHRQTRSTVPIISNPDHILSCRSHAVFRAKENLEIYIGMFGQQIDGVVQVPVDGRGIGNNPRASLTQVFARVLHQ